LFKDGSPVKLVKAQTGYLLELPEVPTDMDTVVELTVD
jgi:hypothetical protein